jgi:hypothetical protein
MRLVGELLVALQGIYGFYALHRNNLVDVLHILMN